MTSSTAGTVARAALLVMIAVLAGVLQSGPIQAQKSNIRIVVRPAGPVHLGEPALFNIVVAYAQDAPDSIRLTPDIGFMASIQRIRRGVFSAKFFIPSFSGDTKVRVSLESAGGREQRPRTILLRPASHAVPTFMPRAESQVTPDRIILGEDNQAIIRLQLFQPGQKPYESARLTAEVNTGDVSAFEHKGDGVYEARYTPPDILHPDVAVVLVRDIRHDFVQAVSIPLWARENFPVEAQPNSQVRLIVGSRTFGPVQADFRGVARVPILVEPGVDRATQLEQGSSGSKRRIIDLATPSIQRFHSVISPDSVQAGGRTRIHIFATPLQGQRASKALVNLKFESAIGTIRPARQVEPGHIVAVFEAPQKLEAQTTDLFLVEGTVDEETGDVTYGDRKTYLTTLEMFPSFPNRILLASVPPRLITKKPPETVFAKVRVLDPHGNPVPNVLLDVKMPGVKIGPITDEGKGNYSVGMKPEEEVQSTQVSELSIDSPALVETTRATDGSAIKPKPAAREIKLALAKPERITFVDPPRSLNGGEREYRMRVEVQDKDGNRLRGEDLIVRANRGKVLETREDDDGVHAVFYQTPERGGAPALITARVKSEKFIESVSVDIKQPAVEVSLLPKGGYIGNTGLAKSVRGGLTMDLVSHKVFGGRLGLQFSGGFYGSNELVDVEDPANPTGRPLGTAETYFWVTPLSAGLIGYIPVPVVEIHVGAAGAFYLVSAGTRNTTSSIAASGPSFDAAYGAEGNIRFLVEFGPGKPFAEFLYSWAQLAGDNRGSGVEGNVGGYSGLVGYMFSF